MAYLSKQGLKFGNLNRTDIQITEISQLTQDYKNEIIPLDVDSDGKHNVHDKDNKLDNRGIWRSLTDELKRHGGIKLAVNVRQKNQAL